MSPSGGFPVGSSERSAWAALHRTQIHVRQKTLRGIGASRAHGPVPAALGDRTGHGQVSAALRDEKKILANVCPRCGRSQLPPREVCAVCRVAVHDFEEVGPEGLLRNFDVVYYASPDPVTGESREVPYASCYVELDGCKGERRYGTSCEKPTSPSSDGTCGCGPSSKRTANAPVRSPISNTSRSSRKVILRASCLQ